MEKRRARPPFVFSFIRNTVWKSDVNCGILSVIAQRRNDMNYATIKNCDIANGPGVRVSLFVSGCTHRCPGCFNEVAWDFDYGQPFTEETIVSIPQPDNNPTNNTNTVKKAAVFRIEFPFPIISLLLISYRRNCCLSNAALNHSTQSDPLYKLMHFYLQKLQDPGLSSCKSAHSQFCCR